MGCLQSRGYSPGTPGRAQVLAVGLISDGKKIAYVRGKTLFEVMVDGSGSASCLQRTHPLRLPTGRRTAGACAIRHVILGRGCRSGTLTPKYKPFQALSVSVVKPLPAL
jgi:hypothetical protein